MCASALAQVGIQRAVFGASNDRFGGSGSVLCLQEGAYEVTRGLFLERSIELLQRFYNRENEHAPDNKRRKKNKELLVSEKE